MPDPATWDRVLTFKRRRALAEMADLERAVAKACPGPHAPVQHRDRKPPWCPACGRDAMGTRQADV